MWREKAVQAKVANLQSTISVIFDSYQRVQGLRADHGRLKSPPHLTYKACDIATPRCHHGERKVNSHLACPCDLDELGVAADP
jgi:hypothetical protein